MGTSARISLTGAPGFWRYTVYLPPGCTRHPCSGSAVASLQAYLTRHGEQCISNKLICKCQQYLRAEGGVRARARVQVGGGEDAQYS